MMRRFAFAFLLVGCGIEEVGERDVLDGSSDVADVALDVVKDVKEEPFVCDDAGPASCTDAVPFRTPALFSPDAGAPCPTGYDTHDLVFTVPSAPTCACTCADAGAPSCDTTSVSYHWGVGVCNTAGSTTLSGACTAVPEVTFNSENLEIDTPAVTGGCGGGTPVPPASKTTNARLCTPQCASDERVCTGVAGLRACVSVGGNVASCPAGYANGPFYIGANPVVTCDNCSCTQNGDCSTSMLHLFTDGNCKTGDQGFAMDGTCHPVTGGHVGSFGSQNVTPNLKTPSCKVTEGASHTTYGGDDFTVCCQ